MPLNGKLCQNNLKVLEERWRDWEKDDDRKIQWMIEVWVWDPSEILNEWTCGNWKLALL